MAQEWPREKGSLQPYAQCDHPPISKARPVKEPTLQGGYRPGARRKSEDLSAEAAQRKQAELDFSHGVIDSCPHCGYKPPSRADTRDSDGPGADKYYRHLDRCKVRRALDGRYVRSDQEEVEWHAKMIQWFPDGPSARATADVVMYDLYLCD